MVLSDLLVLLLTFYMDELHNQWRENASASIKLSFPETIIHLQEKHPENTIRKLECLNPMNNKKIMGLTWDQTGLVD